MEPKLILAGFLILVIIGVAIYEIILNTSTTTASTKPSSETPIVSNPVSPIVTTPSATVPSTSTTTLTPSATVPSTSTTTLTPSATVPSTSTTTLTPSATTTSLPVTTNSYQGVTTLGQPVPIGYALSCSTGTDPTSGIGNIYNLTGNNSISLYPNPTIAASCDPNWQTGINRIINCTGFNVGSPQTLCATTVAQAPTTVTQAPLPVTTNSYPGVTTLGQQVPIGYAVSCSTGDPLNSTSAIYKLTAANTLSHYPNEAIASSCDSNWQTGINRQINCSSMTLGPDQTMCS